MSQPQHPRLKQAGFGLITTLFVLALLECGSRLAGHVAFPNDPLITEEHAGWGKQRRYHPQLFWTMRPHLTNEHGPLTNSAGIRGPETPAEKGDEFRILSLGESTTYSARMPYSECYSAQLEALLGTLGNRPVRVINGGVPGYSSVQGYVFLEQYGIDYEPDAVLVYFGYNDLLSVAFRAERDYKVDDSAGGLTDRELLLKRRRLANRSADWMYRRSNLARRVGAAIHGRRLEAAAGDEGVERAQNRPRVPDEDRMTTFRQYRDFCAEHGIDLVIIVPWYREFEDHVLLLREFAAENSVAIVDLPQHLSDLPQPRESYFYDRVHPLPEGHALIAREIADIVRDRWN